MGAPASPPCVAGATGNSSAAVWRLECSRPAPRAAQSAVCWPLKVEYPIRASLLPPPPPAAPLTPPSPFCSYALWLDADLTRGLSRNCTTFGNSSLAGQEEFEVGAVELWGLS